MEILGKVERARRDRAVVVDDAVAEGVEARKDGGAARGAERSGDEGVLEVDAVAREGVEMRRLGDRVAHEAHRIGAMVVGEDQNNVLGLRAGDAFGDDAGGDGNNGGAECGASEDEAGEEETANRGRRHAR